MTKKPPAKKTKKQIAAEAKAEERREQAAIDAAAERLTRESNRRGHIVRHATSRSGMHLTPLLDQPIPTPAGQQIKVCVTCQVHHPCKTLHIWTDDKGDATVSDGVYELLKKVGMDGFVLQSMRHMWRTGHM